MREFKFRIYCSETLKDITVQAETEEEAREIARERILETITTQKLDEVKPILDMFGNELQCGDMVCFVANPDADWRQTKNLVRVKIKAFVSNKTQDFIMYDENRPKVIATRVVKCY